MATAAHQSDDAWRAWFAAGSVLALAYALYVGRGAPGVIPLALLAVSLGFASVAVLARERPWLPRRVRVGRLLGFGLAVQLALLLVWPLTDPFLLPGLDAYLPFWLGMAVVTVLAAAPLFGVLRDGPVRLVALVVVHLAIGVWVIAQVADPFIDLWIMQADGARALVEGVNPYLPIYPNIHGPDSPYYGPGLVVDGKLTIGFPYPPWSLLLVAPAELLAGDPRYAHLVAIGGATLLMAASRPGPTATGAALLYLFTPWTFLMVAGSWTEPLVVLFLAATVTAALRSPRLLGVALGLLIGVKQYMLLALPLALWQLAHNGAERWRVGVQSVVVALVITVPFVLWDPGAFAWSTLGSLAVQAFRPDSLTYLAVLPGDWGPRLSILGFLLLLPLGALIAWRAPRSPSGFAASVGLALLLFFAFSRQGSTNYYVAVIGALCCSVAAGDWLPKAEPRVGSS